MKLNLLVNIILALSLSTSIYAECSKNEVIKLVDKGFSKSEIDNICNKTVIKWASPSEHNCRSNGGGYSPSTSSCWSTWSEAKNICRASGGRLPSIDELKNEVSKCGGISKNYDSEDMSYGYMDISSESHKSYIACIKNADFGTTYYWSSTTNGDSSNVAWINYFRTGGYAYVPMKRDDFLIRCIEN